MNAKTLMVQGTTSDAGKSTLVAALCRLLVRQHFKVAPFKPQNMALNSAVTACGGEIGRAQAVQAIAANIEPEVDFNPILLKPNSDTGAQVIVHGKAISDMEASAYHDYKKVAMDAVLQSHERLAKRFEYIIVEGAGSPAEINLRAGDVANMGFAEAVDCPVILIADIDRGGVFAHLVGTLALLSESEQARVVGFVINRFRGDITLLQSGLDWLEEKTNKPVLGVLPYLHGLTIAAEDAVDDSQNVDEEACGSENSSNEKTTTKTVKKVHLKVIVPVYPRMSNHSDFDSLRWHPDIDLTFVYADDAESKSLPEADFIILPGSKNVRADLTFLKKQGWHIDIAKHLRYGGKLWGVCGGYQMLGETIADPLGIEGEVGVSQGLGYLPFDTELKQHNKTLDKAKVKFKETGKAAEKSGGGIKKFIASAAGLVGVTLVLGKIRDGFSSLAVEVFKTGDEFELLSKRLSGDELKFVEQFARDTPLQMQGVANAFVKLKAFGIDPTLGAMQDLVDQNAKVGGGQAELEGLIGAVGKGE